MSLEYLSGGQYHHISERFWQETGQIPYFPCDIERGILRVLPIAVVHRPRLNTDSVNLYLAQQGSSITLAEFSSRLHGCLIAYKGNGLIVIDGLDSDNEKRFTLAHEAAHFILHYLIPRDQAVKRLGEDILEVLDGERPPTNMERVDSILSKVRIGVHSHLLTSGKFGLNDSQIESVEFGADRLALELLAPFKEVVGRLRIKSALSKYDDRIKLISRLLQVDFGIPTEIAESASPLFEGAWNKPFSIDEWLK